MLYNLIYNGFSDEVFHIKDLTFFVSDIMISIQSLPAEVLYNIFTFLGVIQLKQAILVCTKWHNIGVDKRLWHSVCRAIKQKTFRQMKEILRAGGR